MILLHQILQDVRFAARQLWKSWVFTSTAVAVLAPGTAASVAIFAFVDGALLKPLPYRNPSRLGGFSTRAPTARGLSTRDISSP